MSILVFIHVVCVALWLGCVLAETIMELTSFNDPGAERVVAKMHFSIDVFVEAPLVILILLTGFLLLDVEQLSGLFLVKVVCGLFALSVNLLCVFFVIKRKLMVDTLKEMDVHRQTKWILSTGAAMPFVVIALAIGISMLELA